eukprot:5951513-Alexandrium_andersonii.AAC.1
MLWRRSARVRAATRPPRCVRNPSHARSKPREASRSGPQVIGAYTNPAHQSAIARPTNGAR